MTHPEKLLIAVPILLAVWVASAHESEAPREGIEGEFGYIGTVNLPITTRSPIVQERFNYALAQYCHMSYETARDAFASLLGEDPECAMAYWGIAMTHTAPVWPMTPTEKNLVPGSQAVEQARRLASGVSERERMYIEAAGALYDSWANVPYAKRLRRWLDAQRALHEAYPDDDEATVLYALALVAVGDSEGDTTLTNHREAGGLLEGMFGRLPEHPGVIHYTIHAYDKPELAEQAVPMARAYAKIAPNMAHANHMPTHIFTRLGYWEDSKVWNERARQAALEVKIGGRTYSEYLHAADYIVYANLQTGHDSEAGEMIARIEEDGPHLQNFVAAYALAAIPARLALERRDWKAAKTLELAWAGNDPDFDWSGQEPCVAVTHFARGIGFALDGEVESAQRELVVLQSIHRGSIGTQRPFWGRRMDAQIRALEACIAYANDDHDGALKQLRDAANREDENGKHPVMPAVVLPLRELYADLLLESKNYAAALSAYEMNLRIRPGRLNSLCGAGRASELLGRRDNAISYYTKALELAANGDTNRLCFHWAKDFFDKH